MKKKILPKKLLIGFECSELNNECFDKIKKIKPNVIQIYLGDKVSTTLKTKPKWTTKEKKEIKDILKKYDIRLFIHSSLRVNICNPLDGKHKKRYVWAVNNVIHDLNYSPTINAKAVTVHLGYAHSKYYELTLSEAITNCVKSIKYMLKNSNIRSTLLIETPAQSGSRVGWKLEDFAKIFNRAKDKRLGVCVIQHFKNIIFLMLFIIFTFLTINYYFSEENIVHINKSRSTYGLTSI